MADYKDWESLSAAVQDSLDDVLVNEVRPLVRTMMYTQIKKGVYGAYTPKKGGWKHGNPPEDTYQRRYSLLHTPTVGGQGGIFSEMWDSHTLFVSSSATASPSVVKGYSFHHRYVGALLALLESENHGIWNGGFARPVVSVIEEQLVPKMDMIMKKNFDVLYTTIIEK